MRLWSQSRRPAVQGTRNCWSGGKKASAEFLSANVCLLKRTKENPSCLHMFPETLASRASPLFIVRSPFREEHLVVVPNFFFFSVYIYQLGEDVLLCPMSHVTPPPCRGYWWSMVLAWDNWSTLSANVHKYMAS